PSMVLCVSGTMSAPAPSVRAFFVAAGSIAAPEEQAAYLDRVCGNDMALRRRLEKLLHAHFRAGSFLQFPPAGPVATIDELPVTEDPGTVIGPYKLLEQIGEGGFGVVFMAEQQEPIRRKVALKIL